ncbi:MAG TPA: hypothetical protein DCR93_03815 [Cytophagales bacterium]|nr:hypothetical protein [Cytophagales bacterium]HAP58661.1 hypothetical protein [Cytophagales bacterium]
MTQKEELLEIINQNLIKLKIFGKTKIKQLNTGEYLINESNDDFSKIIQVTFKISNNGFKLGSLTSWTSVNKIENITNKYLNKINLPNPTNHTLVYSEKSQKLFRKLTRGTYTLHEFRGLITQYLDPNLVDFFAYSTTYEGLLNHIENHKLSQIQSLGIGGKYPANIIKCIIIYYLNNRAKSAEKLIAEFIDWAEIDKENPRHGKHYDTYIELLNRIRSDFTE